MMGNATVFTVQYFMRLLTEADEDGCRAPRPGSIEETLTLSSPEIVRELAFFACFGKVVMGNHSLEGTLAWGTYTGEQVVGVVAAERGLERGNSWTIHLWGLCVYPEFRGVVVGTLLLRAAIAWIRQQPATASVVLYANHGQSHALAIFRQLGFEFVPDEALRGTKLCAWQLDCRAADSAFARRTGGLDPKLVAEGQPSIADSRGKDRSAGRDALSG